jgi:photosynthetic reaction center cytochrome c subunit
MTRIQSLLLPALLAGAALLAGCEKPPMETTQTGYRGLAMGAVNNPRIVGPLHDAQTLPDPIAVIPVAAGAPLAKDTYQNVQVLGDLPATELTRTMLAITAWVSPKQGCVYCHAPGEALSSDKLYTKVVARKMIAMTRHINADWKNHVATTGVTCYTCHRGEPVPAKIWFTEPAHRSSGGATAESFGQNHPSQLAGLTSLGIDPLTPYLLKDTPIRSAGTTALPTGNKASIQQTEGTFGLMVHMSKSLGVNCTHCHNTRSHADWAGSPPQRTQAFHGIKMARDINVAYMEPLTSTFPANRLGGLGDVAKVNCATCHQGVNKPLKGAPMLKDHPALAGPWGAAAVAAAAAPQAAAPVAALSGPLGRILFEVGKVDLGAQAREAIDKVLAALKAQPDLKVALSGYADKTGNADKNLALAKERATAVRDALKAAGVAEDRVEMRKPEFAVGGDSADARRVDILPAKAS